MKPAFVYETQIMMRHTDAAGIVFFARYYELMHDAFEAFLASRGMPVSKILHETTYILPLVHTECDYRLAMRWGDPLTIEVTVDEVRRRSFKLGYRFLNADGKATAHGIMSHVAVDKASMKAVPIPADLRHALEGS